MSLLPANGFLRLPQVFALIPVSRSVWWAGYKSVRYPKPVKLGPHTTAWRASDIAALWKSSQPKRRKNETCFFPGTSSVTSARVPEAVIRLWMLAGDGRGSLRRGLGQRKFAGRKHKDNDTKKRFPPPAVFPHTDTRRTRYMQTRPGSYSTRYSRQIHCYRSPCAQMPAPSRSSCRPHFGSDTGRMCFVWCSGSCRIPSPHVLDVYLEPSVYPPATRRIQLRSTVDTHPLHSRCPHHASPFLRGCLFIRPALSPKASLRFVYTLRV